MTPRRRAVLVTSGLVGALVLVPVSAAHAHPLGNFTVNHYRGLTVRPTGVDLLAVVDLAEIPTQQELPTIDTDGNDDPSTTELAAHAAAECAALTAMSSLGVDGSPVELALGQSSLESLPGAAGLPTLRLTCVLSARADLSGAAAVTFADEYRGDRVGWHEITARGEGLRIVESPVTAESVSQELRAYPEDLLSSPLDDRAVSLRVEPGDGESVAGAGPTGTSQDPFTRLVAWGDRELQRALGERELTPAVGALAVVLALLLGAGHALLPGHGKTVMAAYLAGRRGSRRDAFMVGATVTGTHTASVLVLGLVINVSAAIVGEQALRYLGLVSGLIIALVGALLLRSAMASRPAAAQALSHAEHPSMAEHSHAGSGRGISGWLSHSHSHPDGHDHRHEHGHDHGHGHDHNHDQGRDHSHEDTGSPQPAGHHHVSKDRAAGRAGLVGMGVAGGLVPSPGALVVLLGSVQLHRPVLGVLLVLLYGVGMAATLTAVGLLLVRARGRLDRLAGTSRLGTGASRVVAALPMVTAALVLLVGIGLAARALISLS